MVQILPYVQSPLEQLTPYINQAAGQIGQKLSQRSALQALQQYHKARQMGSTENGMQGGYATQDPLQFAAEVEIAKKADIDPNAYSQAVLANQRSAEKQSLQQQKFQQQMIQKAEPELLERENKLNQYEQEGARFERLQELFSPELENKFPSSFSVGLFTKDGELRPTAASLLSPEAQEAVKLIADNLSGAKDTFGARVTNFDLQSYMKRLPTLLNSSEGRRRVLRDLRLMNKLNTMHQEGVLEIVEREGGPGKISLSQAERRYRKEHAKEIANLKKEFVSPEKYNFTEKPDAKVYSGRVIVDEETGEKFRSNGQEWVPE